MTTPTRKKKPVYANPTAQVLFAVAAAVVLGYFRPATAIAMKPLGDGFIRLITMIITLIIFCTVVTGIAGMEDLKKVGRVGGKALIYFEVVSTLALVIGLFVGNVVKPGTSFNINPATLDAKAVADYSGQAKAQNVPDFILHIIPSTVVDAFAKGDILQVMLISILFGIALSAVGPRSKPLVEFFDALTHAVVDAIGPQVALTAPQLVEAQVACDGVNPAAEVERVVHPIHHPERLHERLLCDILGVVTVTQDPVG